MALCSINHERNCHRRELPAPDSSTAAQSFRRRRRLIQLWIVQHVFDIYSANQTDTERYILGTEGSNKLFVVGLNPSTATAEKSDTTVSKVHTVAENNGFQGFVMLNLYPLRSTDPRQLPANSNQSTIAANIRSISGIVSGTENPVFWAAWGGDVEIRPYLRDALADLHRLVMSLGGSWVHFGALTRSGHPRHPSRLAYDWEFAEFNMSTYLQPDTRQVQVGGRQRAASLPAASGA